MTIPSRRDFIPGNTPLKQLKAPVTLKLRKQLAKRLLNVRLTDRQTGAERVIPVRFQRGFDGGGTQHAGGAY